MQKHKGLQGTFCSPARPVPPLPVCPQSPAQSHNEALAYKCCRESPVWGLTPLSLAHKPQRSDEGMLRPFANAGCHCKCVVQKATKMKEKITKLGEEHVPNVLQNSQAKPPTEFTGNSGSTRHTPQTAPALALPWPAESRTLPDRRGSSRSSFWMSKGSSHLKVSFEKGDVGSLPPCCLALHPPTLQGAEARCRLLSRSPRCVLESLKLRRHCGLRAKPAPSAGSATAVTSF